MLQAQNYQQPDDFFRLQAALMRWVQEVGHCNLWHKGDIGHRLFNGCANYPSADMLRYWVDETGEIRAFVIFYPHWEVFDLQVAPELRSSETHIALFESCERETLRLAQRFDIKFEAMIADVFDCDPTYAAFVEARGYQYDKLGLTMTRHDLQDLPQAPLPEGFHFHDATAADAERLADVHNNSFTNKWNAASYLAVFSAPHLEYELVVVAPDGRFAAFTNVWIDQLNRSLLFEPVGTHADFRRRGIATALMVYAMRRMRAEHDIECAYVCHDPPAKNPASGPLYASLGFQKLHEIYEYRRSITAEDWARLSQG